MTLAEKIEKVRQDAEILYDELNRKYDEDVSSLKENALREIADLCLAEGKTKCRDCQGNGAVMRLDAGYMRRFGLRDWDGCRRCGGDGDRKGRGYE